MFQEPVLLDVSVMGSTSEGYYYEPLTHDSDADGGGGGVVTTGFTQEGVYVVNGDNVTEKMIYVLNAQGELAGVAFADGDGNWDNELTALASGLGCAGSTGMTVLSAGATAFFSGTAAVGTCIMWGQDFGELNAEYGWFNDDTGNYSNSAF